MNTPEIFIAKVIRSINRVIRAASTCGGYVCGKYVRDVLVPKHHGLSVNDWPNIVNLRFDDDESYQTFLHSVQEPLVVDSTGLTPWNEVEYRMAYYLSEDHTMDIIVTISETALVKDVDVNQLIARIGEDNEATFESTHPELSAIELQKKILSKQVHIPEVAYEEARKDQVVMERLHKAILNYIANGWTVDESANNGTIERPLEEA